MLLVTGPQYALSGSAASLRPPHESLVVRLRHEGVAETVLRFREEVTTPAVLPAVCYRGVRPWQRGGAEPSGQRTLIPRDGDRSASQGRDCQHQGGWGPAARGTVNPGEPPQAPSPTNKPKVLTGLDQNGAWPGPGAPNSPGADVGPLA